MELVVRYTGRYRPIAPIPWKVGDLQGRILERLPANIFTITRDQVRLFRNSCGDMTQLTAADWATEDRQRRDISNAAL
jgi:hypothetical protein